MEPLRRAAKRTRHQPEEPIVEVLLDYFDDDVFPEELDGTLIPVFGEPSAHARTVRMPASKAAALTASGQLLEQQVEGLKAEIRKLYRDHNAELTDVWPLWEKAA